MAPPEGAEADPATTVVAELLKALKEFKSSPTDILRPPTFDWNSTDPYEDFRLFIKGMNSWFTLNALPDEDGESTIRLEYLLNFLGPNARRKHEQWTPRGDSDAERSRKKKSAKEFLEYLHSTMDHPVSQRCRIYQLEEIRIRPGETHDELVERIRNLADRCNFPSDAEKERHVQFRLVRALNDADLVRKLLMLKLDAPTSEMLSICQTHSALDTGLTEMGLRKLTPYRRLLEDDVNNHPKDSVAIAPRSTPQDGTTALQEMPHVMDAETRDTGKPNAVNRRRQIKARHLGDLTTPRSPREGGPMRLMSTRTKSQLPD